ncbi:MAG: site-specific integrase [Candidatus Limnocylindrales bacterium]
MTTATAQRGSGSADLALQRFTMALVARKYLPQTVRTYVRMVEGYLAFLAEQGEQWADPDRSTLRLYLAMLSETNGPSSRSLKVGVLRAFYGCAQRAGLVAGNPWALVADLVVMAEPCAAATGDQHRCTRAATDVRDDHPVCFQHAALEWVQWDDERRAIIDKLNLEPIVERPDIRESNESNGNRRTPGVGWYLFPLSVGGPVARARARDRVRDILATHLGGISESGARRLTSMRREDFRSIAAELVAAGEMTSVQRGEVTWYAAILRRAPETRIRRGNPGHRPLPQPLVPGGRGAAHANPRSTRTPSSSRAIHEAYVYAAGRFRGMSLVDIAALGRGSA